MSTSFPIGVQLKATDKLSGALKRVGAVAGRALKGGLDKARASTRRLSQRMKRLRQRLKRVRKTAKRAVSALGGLGRVAGVVGGALGGVASTLWKLTVGYAEGTDELIKYSRTIGFNVEALQEWQFAADRGGVKTEQLRTAISMMSKNIGEARLGTGQLSTVLKKGSPALLEQLKNTKDNSEAFELLVQGMRQLGSVQDRAALAQAAFGRQGKAMMRIANMSGREIEGLRKKAHDYGAVIGQDAAKKSEKFVDTMTDFKAKVGGLKAAIGQKLLPVLQPLIIKLGDWILKNRDLIASKIAEYVEKLAKWLEGVDWGRVLRAVESIAKGFATMAEHIDLVIAGIGAVIGAKTIAGLMQLRSLLGMGGAAGGGAASAAGGAAAKGGAAAATAAGGRAAAVAAGATTLSILAAGYAHAKHKVGEIEKTTDMTRKLEYLTGRKKLGESLVAEGRARQAAVMRRISPEEMAQIRAARAARAEKKYLSKRAAGRAAHYKLLQARRAEKVKVDIHVKGNTDAVQKVTTKSTKGVTTKGDVGRRKIGTGGA